MVGKQEVGPTGNAARCPPTGDSVALSVTSSSNYCTQVCRSPLNLGRPSIRELVSGFASIKQTITSDLKPEEIAPQPSLLHITPQKAPAKKVLDKR
jgi:hypothetical protein